MRKSFIDRFKEEENKEQFWTFGKKVGAVCAVFVLAVIMLTGCSQQQDVSVDISPVQELEKENIKVGNDGVNAAIAPDEVSKQPSESMVAMSVEDMGRSDPFLPNGSTNVVKQDYIDGYDLLPPPESITVDEAAAEVITTKVSGIMYDRNNPSAIIKIADADYLVRTGDVINGYKVLSIGREIVTVQHGANVYKAGVGELFADDGIHFNTVSNLENKFGGQKKSANKK